MDPVIRFAHVSKRYDLGRTRRSLAAAAWQRLHRAWNAGDQHGRDFWALRDVSFALDPGTSLALVGPNGAGKSTILKLLARITEPTSGTVDVRGRIAALIELGAGFHPDLTGRENVYLNATLLGLRRAEVAARFDEIVAFAELERFIDTPIKRYSSGMTVRLGFAVASCIEPDVLLVDEVLAVGDAAFRQRCVARVRQLIARGTSLLFVSHDMGLVKALCQHALYVDEGELKYAGDTATAIDHYTRAVDRQRQARLNTAGARDESPTPVEITSVEVLDAEGRAARVTRATGSLEIRINYAAHTDLSSGNVLVRVMRVDGVSCFVLRTSHDGVPVAFSEGAGAISVVIESPRLYPGTYYAVAWVLDGSDANGMSRGTSDWFEVAADIPGLDADDGVFEPEHHWVSTNRADSRGRPASEDAIITRGRR